MAQQVKKWPQLEKKGDSYFPAAPHNWNSMNKRHHNPVLYVHLHMGNHYMGFALSGL